MHTITDGIFLHYVLVAVCPGAYLSLGVSDDLAGDARHAGHGAVDDGRGGQRTEKLRLGSQRSGVNLSRNITACFRQLQVKQTHGCGSEQDVLRWRG